MPTDTAPAPPARRGACPGVLDPMEAADGWLVRIRLPGGRISADQLRGVASLAARYGSGVVELTSRANLQLRGVAAGSLTHVGHLLVECGLAAATAAADVRRAVVASPLAGHDPTEAADVSPVVKAVLAALAAADLPPLPAKFGVTIDGGGLIDVRGVPATVRLTAAPSAGGAPHWRLDATVGSPGTDPDLVTDLDAADPRALAARVLDAVTASTAWPDPRAADAGGRSRRPASAVPVAGVLPHRRDGMVNVVAHAFLGRTDAAALDAIGDMAVRALDVRAMPGGIVLLGVGRAASGAAADTLAALGFVVDPLDARLGIGACIGAPGCASARADTGAAAQTLAARAPTSAATRAAGVPRDVPAAAGGRPVYLAACEKGCGAPVGAQVLVAGADGRFALDGGSPA